MLILRDLLPGTKRFGELKKSIGHVSQKVLTAQLRDMEQKRPGPPAGLCRGAPQSGVQPDRLGSKPQAHPGRHAGLGGGVQGREVAGMRLFLHPLFGAAAPNQHHLFCGLRRELGNTAPPPFPGAFSHIHSKTACRGFKSFCPCQVYLPKMMQVRKKPGIPGLFSRFEGRKRPVTA